jgi:hypothetical protein
MMGRTRHHSANARRSKAAHQSSCPSGTASDALTNR